MTQPFFTSDTHFFHKWAAKKRGFDSVEAMNLHMIEAWNSRVSPDDLVFHLGDVSFDNNMVTAGVLAALNGRIVLVRGNHDRNMNLAVLGRFTEIADLKEVRLPCVGPENTGPIDIVLCHFPLLEWHRSHYGTWHLHGHTHGSCEYPADMALAPVFDVGVDSAPQANFEPRSFAEIAGLMATRTKGYSASNRRITKETA